MCDGFMCVMAFIAICFFFKVKYENRVIEQED